jgi:ActR/RegA family two-component response regulator
MSSHLPDRETILIVEDEESVRRTFREWLESANLSCDVLTAADAESALVQANQRLIDLAILDWNLGAGNDGLQLLEDLAVFNPDVVAILVTGFAHQATPLHAMRMGVRDYLDKNQDLDRTTFLTAVNRQLERIRPAKRERRLHHNLVAFREAVEKVLPLVQSTNALQDPVPVPQVIGSLFRFLLHITSASDGVLLVRSYDDAREPAETYRVYDASGDLLNEECVPFARSLAGTVVSLQEPHALPHLDEAARTHGLELQPFERGRRSLLAAPLTVAAGVHVVLELFDKRGPTHELLASGFTDDDRRLLAAAADLGAAMLRQALTEKQMQKVLFDAIGAALGAGDSLIDTLRGSAAQRREGPAPEAVLKQLREGLQTTLGPEQSEGTVALAEAIRVLTSRHGPAALRHCLRLVNNLRELLDEVTNIGATDTR